MINQQNSKTKVGKTLIRKVTNLFTDLKFAISLLLILAVVSSLGTIVEQNKNSDFYTQAYPESNPLFNWRVIQLLQLDHIFQAWWYFLLIMLLGISLMMCTLRVQYPILKISRKYLFFLSEKQMRRYSFCKKIPSESLSYILKNIFLTDHYIFYKKNMSYAHRGLNGQVASILIHFSLLFLLFGTASSALRSYIGQEMIVTGEVFHIQNLSTFGILSHLPQNVIGRVNNFWITYDKDNNIKQFYSDISIVDTEYHEEVRKKIFVNSPLKYNGLTIYQTDWNLVGIRLLLDGKFSVQIPLQKIGETSNQNLWTGSLRSDSQTLLSFIVQNSNDKDKILVYNSQGTFIQKAHILSSININKHEVQILDIIQATGLQIKQDPGLNLVYGGFLCLMISVLVNCIPYRQVWLVQTKDQNYLVGDSKKNPSQLFQQLSQIVKKFYSRYVF
mmetsp:Transcript_43909/g.171604  ORF Transcript_43909/g.171604 Transcript_43909/m.171604 type:complete len:444 (-) Transcript_43909:577-1908(-)